MTQNSLVLVLPVITLIVGALLNHFLSRASDTRRELSALKIQAYVDYLRCVAEAAHIKRNDIVATSQLNARAADAKSRIAIYGSPEVIAALADFGRAGAHTADPAARTKLLKLYEVMRDERGHSSSQKDIGNLRAILFGDQTN